MGLSHIDDSGAARMVDVSAKPETVRTAVATGRVLLSTEALSLARTGDLPKGDLTAVVRLAGIMAAKRTSELIPLCHPLALHDVDVDVQIAEAAVELTATVRTVDRTGVEMEALTAVSVAGLTVIDMVKAVDRAATLTDVQVAAKTGGRSGDWSRQ
jgi:cyclic pyranopterin phosphate synthase